MLELHERNQLKGDELFWFMNKPEEELYDTNTDPHEVNNLASDPEHQAIKLKLSNELDQWMNEYGDMGLMTEKERVWQMWPDGIQPVTKNPIVIQEGKNIMLSCDTEGASIGYRLSKNKNWQVYHQPFDLSAGDTLEVIAHRIGFKPSEIVGI